ncbi:hypothetical protein SLEP1_g39578 [Rubroshorea leprosula]|uniref:Uncharacterized protein n=1 Tax=Rubroshorea leprosula TaxID=152421 RepID=A0AAV5L149_9ROSI|nr:hypothetical protein SLEP1_g39578 [Rubroshorea leprosula]
MAKFSKFLVKKLAVQGEMKGNEGQRGATRSKATTFSG